MSDAFSCKREVAKVSLTGRARPRLAFVRQLIFIPAVEEVR